ncbi:Type II secretion system protein E [Novipirellula galeiformis]|uniref:Type II secretion system protein E n=1 Tax=Novipirellula galeiformis TaxID=2528004 RepID=A0A5C6C1Q9_9BACT|nr:GspE/PulE family protein [Novipirellula galeiformis]TWU17144.1 Type II secretion system protein E [Novipirellula galeiformis]
MIANTVALHPQLDSTQLRQLADTLRDGDPLETLVDRWSFNNRQELLAVSASSLGLEWLDTDEGDLPADAMEGFPMKLIHRHEVFPLERGPGWIKLAISNPFDFAAVDSVASALEVEVRPVVATAETVQRLIKRNLGVGSETIDGLIALQRQAGDVEMLEELDADSLEDAEEAQQASVVRLVNEILSEAIEVRASDIHVESQEAGLKLRYRIDGVLQKQPTPPEMNQFRAAIISRLKIMAKMNIAEKRIPQDGRIKLRVAGREVDVRVSIIPMLHGEGVVMRVLDKSNLSFSLKGVGMPDSVYEKFQKLIRLPHGIVLVTGPTGSGKTTTLYSALSEIKSEDNKIVTTEDPIEYQLDGINQIQVHTKVGLTFAACLRAILRHDPDVVLIGEIRDLETAENATQASLTGHMVFSTLHTNDSAGAFMRLNDMGVEPFLVANTVEGVLAQRLVRVLCDDCKEPYRPDVDELPDDFPAEARLDPRLLMYRPGGCENCRRTGYRGRMGIYELLVTNEEVRQLASQGASSDLIKKAAMQSGMETLRMDGWNKALAGVTTIDEVLRVTKAD